MISSHVKVSMISLTSGLSLKLYLISLVFHRNIFGSSSKVFGHLKVSEILEKCSETLVWTLGQFWKNLRKSSESGRKSSENHQKRRYQYVFIIHCSCHSNIKFISSRHRVISSIPFLHLLVFFAFRGYMTNSQRGQLPVGLMAQLAEHCTGIVTFIIILSERFTVFNLSNRPQVSMVYRLINHAGCW